jgi:hypothetical protein
MSHARFSDTRHFFDHFSAGVYEGRWGSIIDAVAALLKVERILRPAWNEAAYKGRADARLEENIRSKSNL